MQTVLVCFAFTLKKRLTDFTATVKGKNARSFDRP